MITAQEILDNCEKYKFNSQNLDFVKWYSDRLKIENNKIKIINTKEVKD